MGRDPARGKMARRGRAAGSAPFGAAFRGSYVAAWPAIWTPSASWPCGASVVYPIGKKGTPNPTIGKLGIWDDFAAGNQPLFHEGVKLEIVPDDGSAKWSELHDRAMQAPVREG